MTITVTASGISLDGPLVAGEVVAVSVSGVTFVEDSKPTLCLLGRFPDALLSSVELTEDENTPGTWTGELDTATKQTAVFFATARADECRDAVLELVAARQSVARLMVAFRNSALCPSPFHAPDASPVYVPVPGPPGQGGDPYDQNPAMDGIASAGVSDKYARGDHVHPTDSSRAAQEDVAAIQNVIPSTATPSNKLATAADIPAAPPSASTATPQMDGTGAAGTATTYARGDHVHPSDTSKLNSDGLANTNGYLSAAGLATRSILDFGRASITAPTNSGAALTDSDISDSTSALGAALDAKADTSSLATVATTGDYGDLLNKPTIPAAQVNADWNAASGVAQILNKPTIPDVNYLPYASTTTLDPATAVYRATATLSGTTATMPTVTITGIPTAAAYFAFELEVAVDATATALDDTAWSGWTWMDGGELPTADYAGKTLFIACRLDCTARTIVANCYDVR